MCFVSTFPPEKDGVGEYLNFLLSAFRKNGSIVFYVLARTMCKPTTTRLDDHTVIIRLWDMSCTFGIIRSLARIVSHVRMTNPDIVHIQYGPTRLYGGTMGEPFLVLMLLLRLVSKARVILSLHSFWLPSQAEQRAYELVRSRLLAKLFRYYYCLYFWVLIRLPSVVLGIVLEQNSSSYRELMSLTRSKKVIEMPHGIPQRSEIDESSRRRIRARLGLENRFVMLLFGHIRRDKAYERVMTALSKVIGRRKELMHKCILIIAGAPLSSEDQDYLRYLIKHAESLGVSRCIKVINKYLDEQEVEMYFVASDVVLLTYGRRVGPSGVLSLALSYNIPAVIDVDGRFVKKESSLPVIIIDDTHPMSLSEVLEYLAFNPEILNALRKQIVDWKRKYSFSRIAKLHEELYRSSRI